MPPDPRLGADERLRATPATGEGWNQRTHPSIYSMKNTHLTLALLTACAVLPVSGLLAQTASPVPATTPSVSAPAATTATATESEEEEGGGKMHKALASLTPEERGKLRAAHKAAMQDPTVEAAKADKSTNKRAFRMAVRNAMLKADPSVGPILEKLKEERHPGKNL